jgi:hypothetical protein
VRRLDCGATELIVLCCYTYIQPRTVESLRLYAPKVDYVGVVGDDFGYWKAIEDRWAKDDLVIVEHDIEIHEDVIAQFSACRSLWCSFPYYLVPPIHTELMAHGLGCIRLRREAMEQVTPDQVQSIEASCVSCAPDNKRGCWRHCDAKITQSMQELGLDVCVHYPRVKHHNPRVPAET